MFARFLHWLKWGRSIPFGDEEGEFTEETKKALAEARKTPLSEYISLEEVIKELKEKN